MRNVLFEKSERVFWNLYARVYDSLPRYFEPYMAQISDVVKVIDSVSNHDELILDAGCGTGNFCIALKRQGYRVVGFDITQEMLKILNGKNRKDKIGISILQGSMEQTFPFKDGSFDFAININALYMLQDPESTLRELSRVLKKGGKLLLSNPQRQPSIWESTAEIINTQGVIGGINKISRLFLLGLFNLLIATQIKKGQYFYWQEQNLRKKLEAVGFKINLIRQTYTANTNLLVLATRTD